eukprot:806364-Prorocentrum_minimum.AAC.1
MYCTTHLEDASEVLPPPPPEIEFDDETKATIAAKMAAAEFAGEEGDIDGAQRLMEVSRNHPTASDP